MPSKPVKNNVLNLMGSGNLIHESVSFFLSPPLLLNPPFFLLPERPQPKWQVCRDDISKDRLD